MKTAASFTIPILAFFVLLFVYTKLAGPLPFSVNSVTTAKTDTFNVSAEGVSEAKPDIALVNAGIQAQGNSVKSAQDQINLSINKVSDAVKKLGVDQKDIKTSNYNINPTYDYQSQTQRITGYSASTNLTIKVRNIDLVNQVIDTATANGANQVGGVSFDVDDKTKAENEARQKAVAAAKKKAEDAAKIAGFKLGRMVNYSESFAPNVRPYPMMAAGAPGVAKQDTAVEPGSSEITVSVTLSYEIF